MTTDTKASPTETNKISDALAKAREDRNGLISERTTQETQLNAILNLPGVDAAILDANPAVIAYRSQIDSINEKITRLDERIAGFERAEKTTEFIAPLLSGFGSVKVLDVSNMTGTVSLATLDASIAEAEGAAKKAKDRLDGLSKIKRAISTAKIPEEVLADFRPVRFVPVDGESAVTLDISTSGGSTGTRRTSGRNPERIVKSPSGAFDGQIVGGSDANFSSWTALAEKCREDGVISPDDWEKLTTQSDGKKRSVSFKQVLLGRYGFASEPVEAEEAA